METPGSGAGPFVRIVDEKDVTAGLDQALRDGLCACFPEDTAVFSVTRAWHGSRSAWCVVAETAGRVTAHVGLVDRVVSAGGVPVRAAGIQNVFVLPDCRGRGLCDLVMTAAMSEAARRGYDCGLLFCVPALEKVYARCGWRLLPGEQVLRTDETGREVPLPEKNIAMFHPLAVCAFPPGVIRLQGNDW